MCVGVASMPGFMDKVMVGNTRGQLAGSGDWVQVAEIFKTGQKIQKLHASHVRLPDFHDRSLSRGKKPSWRAREERGCKIFGFVSARVGLSAAVPIRE
jgi:hypothetical protein